jgi:hypothetical protein
VHALLVAALMGLGAPAPATATVSCAERIETGRASAEQRREGRRASIFLPDVRFWGLRRWRSHEFEPGSGPDGGDPVVRAAISVRFPGPTTGHVGRWTGWAGGLLVAHAGCATLLVRTAGDWQRVPVELGADCP